MLHRNPSAWRHDCHSGVSTIVLVHGVVASLSPRRSVFLQSTPVLKYVITCNPCSEPLCGCTVSVQSALNLCAQFSLDHQETTYALCTAPCQTLLARQPLVIEHNFKVSLADSGSRRGDDHTTN